MKKRSGLFMACLLLPSVLLAISVTAKQETPWENYAYGTLEKYDDAWSARVVHGFWNLKVTGEKVWFNGYYLEENLDADVEGSPVGSTDVFEWILHGKPIMMMRVGDTLYIAAKVLIKKSWAQFDGTYTSRSIETWQVLAFDFSECEFLRDVYPPDPEVDPPPLWQDFDVRGKITAHSFSPP